MTRIFPIALGVAVVLPVSAYAGGMGDPSLVMRQKNAICEAQKRGEAPPYPNLCLPEYPLAPLPERGTRRVK